VQSIINGDLRIEVLVEKRIELKVLEKNRSQIRVGIFKKNSKPSKMGSSLNYSNSGMPTPS
jgi:hypothetical protein